MMFSGDARRIKAVRRSDKIIVMDMRSGSQIRYVLPTRQVTGLVSHCEKNLSLTVDTETLAVRITPVPRGACLHLGPAVARDGVNVKVKCGCSSKEKELLHAAHECAVHGRCLPTLVPTDLAAWQARKPESEIYHLCHGCGEKECSPG